MVQCGVRYIQVGSSFSSYYVFVFQNKYICKTSYFEIISENRSN